MEHTAFLVLVPGVGFLSVVVCALTYQRPDGLERLLRGLFGQTFAGREPEVEIIIVDNDSAETARAIVLSQSELDIP